MKSLIAPMFGIHAASDAAINFPRCFSVANSAFRFVLLPRARHCALPSVLVAANGGGYTRASRDAQSLVEQNFFKRGEEQQYLGVLAGIAHQAHAPDFSFYWTEATGNFNIEFVE